MSVDLNTWPTGAAFNPITFKKFVDEQNITAVVFDFDRVISVGEGFNANTATCAKDTVAEWTLKLQKKKPEYQNENKDTIVKTLLGGQTRFEELRRVFSVVSDSVDRFLVVTNNECLGIVKSVVRMIEGDVETSKQIEVHTMKGPLATRFHIDTLGVVSKCTFLKVHLRDQKRVLFFDDDVKNFHMCRHKWAADKFIRVAVTSTRSLDTSDQNEEIRKIFSRDTVKQYESLALRTVGPLSLTDFDSKSGIGMRMRSKTWADESSPEWNEYLDTVEPPIDAASEDHVSTESSFCNVM
jgi:hypothetical protein